ncbi:MAG: hypothetical protein SGPRY_015000, partial [Prymnesium sp.]
IHNPYASDYPSRSASYQSGYMLRDNMKRHVRSQYDPEEKYFLPPSVQNEIGWGISAKYKDACAKFQVDLSSVGTVARSERAHFKLPMTKLELELVSMCYRMGRHGMGAPARTSPSFQNVCCLVLATISLDR